MKRTLLPALCALLFASGNAFPVECDVSGAVRTFTDINVRIARPNITAQDKSNIEDIFRNFACAVFEATEGHHRIGTVKIRVSDEEDVDFENPDILWHKTTNTPYATMPVLKIKECDGTPSLLGGGPIHIFTTKGDGTRLLDGGEYGKASAAASLAHEWGHAAYCLLDEYIGGNQSAGLPGTLMSFFRLRIRGDGGFNWKAFNYSTPIDGPSSAYRILRTCAQYTDQKQSAWEQMLEIDPKCFGGFRSPTTGRLSRDFLPGVQLPGSSGTATMDFKVVWLDKPIRGICVDCSGSMAQNNRMVNAIRATKASIATIPDGSLVAVWGFSDSHWVLADFTEVDDRKSGTRGNRGAIMRAVDSLSEGGGTSIWDTLDAMIDTIVAKRSAENQSPSQWADISFLTDGEDNMSSKDYQSIVQRAAANHIRIHAIPYGDGASNSELKAVANGTGGTFRPAGDNGLELVEAQSRSGSEAPGRVSLGDLRKSANASGNVSSSLQIDSSIRQLHLTVAVGPTSRRPSVALVNSATGRTVSPILSDVSAGTGGVATFKVENPSVGQWVVKVDGADPGAMVSIQAKGTPSFDSPQLRTIVKGTVVYAELQKGVPIDGATVTGTAINGSKRVSYAFKAVGNGVYTLDLAKCGNIIGGMVVTAAARAGAAKERHDLSFLPEPLAGPVARVSETFVRCTFLDISQRVESTVTFDPRGGKVSPKSKTYRIGTPFRQSFPIPVRKGYAFNGWYTRININGSSFEEMKGMGSGDATSADATFYAKWSLKRYKLNKTFYAEGGKLPWDYFRLTRRYYSVTKARTIGIKSFTVGKKFGMLPKPTRKGYAFAGWFSDADGGTRITPKTIVPDSGALLALHAHWKAKKVKVSFNPNGGKVSPKKLKYTYDAKYGTLPVAKRAGYKFAGWYTAKKGGARIVESSKVTLRRTLHAHWVKTFYVVSFNANKGKVSTKRKKVVYGKQLGKLPTPKRKNYAFLGWYTAKKGGRKLTASSVASGDRTLYARWTKGLVVNFDYNDGTGRRKTVVFPASLKNAQTLVVTRNGYDLRGWFLVRNSPNYGDMLFREHHNRLYGDVYDFNWPTKSVKRKGKYGDGSTYIYEEDVFVSPVTVYATWDVWVDFDPMGGEVKPASNSFVVGKSFWNSGRWCTGFPTPAKDGFDFAGWFTAPYSGTRLTGWEKASKPMTLYAHWTGASEMESAPPPDSDGSATFPSAWGIKFRTDGTTTWREAFFEETNCAESGAIGGGGTSTLAASVEGSGTLAFRWRTSCEEGRDIVFFSVDGKDVSSRSGLDDDWTAVSFRIEGDGPHALSWTYAKDASGSAGDDRARLADVVWIAD